MALPTLIKTYAFSPNNADTTGTAFTGYGPTMYAWKTALTTLGASPWTVVSSSDGLSNAGAADYWDGPTKCATHNNSGNRSWIVLEQAALGGLQFCLQLEKNGGGASTIMGVYISEGGLFTGGTLTARPTATDEVDTANGTGRHNWTDAVDCTVNPVKIHIAMSTDGKVTRWWIYTQNFCPCFYSIEEPKDAVSGWTPPWLCVACVDWYASTNFRPTYAYLNDIKTNTAWRHSGAKQQFFMTSEGYNDDMCGQKQTWVNDLDSNAWPFYPIGVFCDVAGSRGRHGMMTDLWWGSTARADGDHYPADLTRKFAQVADLIVPWLGDGTIMQIA